MKQDWWSCDGGGYEGDTGSAPAASESRRPVSVPVSRRGLLLGSVLGAVAWATGGRTALADVAVAPGRPGGNVLVTLFLRGGADGLRLIAVQRAQVHVVGTAADELRQRIDRRLLHVAVRVSRERAQAGCVRQQGGGAGGVQAHVPVGVRGEPAEPRPRLLGSDPRERDRRVGARVPRNPTRGAAGRVPRQGVHPSRQHAHEGRIGAARGVRHGGRAKAYLPDAVVQRGPERATVSTLRGERTVAEAPRWLGPRARSGGRRQRIARAEERIADAPQRAAGDQPNARIGVPQSGRDGHGGVTPVFRDQDAADQGRVGTRLRLRRNGGQQQTGD